MARSTPNLEAVAQFLAEEERKKRKPAREEKLVSIDGAPAGRAAYIRYSDDGQGNLTGKEGEIPDGYMSSLAGAGYRVADAASMQEARAAMGQARPPDGKLPFISGVPVHPAPKGYSGQVPPGGDQGMAKAMSLAASARPGGMQAPPVAPARPASTRRSSSRDVQVGLTSGGVQPQLRKPTERPYSAPAAGSADRFLGLPEGVANHMRQRSGLSVAQEDANRRAMGVELASAFNQIGSGISGARYDDKAWDGQRTAAGQPVADHLLRDEDERRTRQEQRAVDHDELAAQEASRAAELELKRFTYGQQRDTAEDALARERMQADREMADARLRSDAADRGLRREEMRFRLKEGADSKADAAKQRADERAARAEQIDLQRVGAATSKGPFGEMEEAFKSIDRLVPGLAYGQVPDELPISAWDRVMRVLEPVGGEYLMTDKGKEYATLIANLRDLVSRKRSGAVLNEGEERHYLRLLGDKILSDPRSAATGINEVRKGMGQTLRTIQGGYAIPRSEGPSVLDQYESTGATTYRAPIFGEAPARPTGEEVDMPDGSVYEVLEDGTTRRKR
jgi:hypothetical protein